MNYAATRDAIVTKLQTVSGIGAVFGRPRWTNNWATFLSLFTMTNSHDATKDVVSLCWITRTTDDESSLSKRDESTVLVSTAAQETWNFTLIYGFEDDDTYPSEYDFQILCDAVMAAFRSLGSASFNTAVVEQSDPLRMTSSGLFMFSDVMAHKAEFQLVIQNYTSS